MEVLSKVRSEKWWKGGHIYRASPIFLFIAAHFTINKQQAIYWFMGKRKYQLTVTSHLVLQIPNSK
ncbi:Uncharacterised protein [Bacteroides xylanisolvens]|nr:Uncharacterised protein [Bacteroides xylanisolvens]